MNLSWFSLRLLVCSLVGTILIASVVLGLVFNQVFDSLSDSAEMLEYQQEKSILQSLAQSYLLSADRAGFLAAWQNNEYTLSVIPKADFPLPRILDQQLIGGEVLVLESEESISLHKLLSKSKEVLTLHLNDSKQDPNGSLRFWLTSLFYLCLLALVLVWLYPLILRLLQLRQAAQQFGVGNFQTRVRVGSISYIADIEREFNRMAQRIENLVSDIRLLSSAVSHDLRTPLARIRFGVETMSEEDDQTQRDYYQQRVISDVDAMVELVEHLLDFSRLEKQLLQAENEAIDLTRFLPPLVRQVERAAVDIQLLMPDTAIYLNSNRHFIAMLVNNLLGNALKFARSQVLLELTQKGQSVILCIEDDGDGISEAKREEILKPFVRDTVAGAEKGYGLGLAIVKRVSEFYRGEVVVASSDRLGGAAFCVTFKSLK